LDPSWFSPVKLSLSNLLIVIYFFIINGKSDTMLPWECRRMKIAKPSGLKLPKVLT